MRAWLNMGLIGVLVVCSSCQTVQEMFSPKTPEEKLQLMKERERMALETAVRKRLTLASKLINEKSYDEAEELLIPLVRYDFCREEVKMLRDTLQIARRDVPDGLGAQQTEQRLSEEVEGGVSLPGTYGKTVVIDSKLDPLELPQGKMEDLINRKVSMNLESASVSMLVDFLNENGLNVIADDQLLGDKPEEKTLTMKVADVPLKEVFSYIARNMGIAFYIGENMVWITAGEETSGPKLETRILRLRQGFVPKVPGGEGAVEDTELEDVLEAFLENSPEGSNYQVFRTRNILVIRNTRENIRFVEQLIREFDKPPMQVVIEARFVTVSQTDLKDVGVQVTQKLRSGYTDEDRNSHNRGRETNFLTTLGTLSSTDSGYGALSLSGVLGKRVFDAVINALDSKESAITLSVPKVAVMNNRSARIREGDRVFYFEEYDLESVDNGDNGTEERLVPSGTPTELPLGVTFDVNVNIGNDGKTVMLGLKPELVELLKWEDFLTSGDDDDDDSDSSEGELTPIRLPHTHEQSVVTTLAVESGETVVLGGMLKKSQKRKVTKVPILGDLPLIGFFFRHTTVSNEPMNMLIFVTATIINPRGEFVKTVDDLSALRKPAPAVPAAKPAAPAPAPAAKPAAPAPAPAAK